MIADSSTLDDVAFLVRSSNRLATLDAVRSSPRTRHELREITGASRVTLSRVLGDLAERGWVERDGSRYAATPLGAVVAAEVARLFDAVEAAGALGGALRWLPVDAFDFDVDRLGDATVIASTDSNLTAAVTHTADRVREAGRVRNVATGVSAEVVDAYLDAARHGCSLETTVHGRVFDAAESDADLRECLAALADADRVALHRYDGDEPPVMVTVCDDRVVVCGRTDPESPPEGVESADPAVRAWAESYVDSIRADAKRVDAFTA